MEIGCKSASGSGAVVSGLDGCRLLSTAVAL